MTLTLLREPPKQIVAGDSIEFYAPIPADLVDFTTGTARLVCQSSTAGTAAMSATSITAENGCFRVKFEGQVSGGTKALTPGQYVLTVWAATGNDRYTIGQWPLTIGPDLSTGSPALRHAQKMLLLLETAIAARISGGEIEEYTIDATNIRKADIEVLERMRSRYAAEVAALQNPGQPLRSVLFELGPTGQPVDPRYRYGR